MNSTTPKASYGLTQIPAGKWSGHHNGMDMPPAIGSRVMVTINGMGAGTVKSYFIEGGWVGCEVQLDQQPEWHIKQCGKGKCPLVFGAELKPVTTTEMKGHTPLSLIAGKECPSCGRDNSDYGNICTAQDCQGVMTYDAAPELLSALEALVPSDMGEHPDDFTLEWRNARAAIKSAKGE